MSGRKRMMIQVDVGLWRQAKAQAAAQGKTLVVWLDAVLRDAVSGYELEKKNIT